MNNSKIWLVVNPTVGIPLFLTAVAVGSFAVHVAVLRNTSWVDDFLQGVPMGTGDAAAAAALETPKLQTENASFVSGTDGQVVLITMPDGTTARAILEAPGPQPLGTY
jgi:light-harvesting protein B-800-850 alpha chain